MAGDPQRQRRSGQGNNGHQRVISLNGEVLFTHDDIKHQTYILEMPVTLLEENTLRVELESKPGTFLTNKVRLCERSEPQSEPFVGQARHYIENIFFG
ncbi:hypothetical protein VT98_11951 [Candidatus Electrothrix communis]|uniref:Uncharacterized protein n=1 Tax=Candidatus Electrothrix communis TaxID=1859133 RepID=A0A444J465_9BACT|nr:hypothetical protein VT98_11951 [Candidatus Electrothrix communis]